MLFPKQLLSKLKASAHSKEAYYEAILYEILHVASNENIEESIKTISKILDDYPYMENTVRTTMRSIADNYLFLKHFYNYPSNEICNNNNNYPQVFEKIVKEFTLNDEFKMELNYNDVNYYYDIFSETQLIDQNAIVKCLLYKSEKIFKRIMKEKFQRKRLEELLKSDDIINFKFPFVFFCSDNMIATLKENGIHFLRLFSKEYILENSHAPQIVFQLMSSTRNLRGVSSENLFVAYITYCHNKIFYGIDLKNEIEVRKVKTLLAFETMRHGFIHGWCGHSIMYMKLNILYEIENFFRYYQHPITSKYILDCIFDVIDIYRPMNPYEDFGTSRKSNFVSRYTMTYLQVFLKTGNMYLVKKTLRKYPGIALINDSYGNNAFQYIRKEDRKEAAELLIEILLEICPYDYILKMMTTGTRYKKPFIRFP